MKRVLVEYMKERKFLYGVSSARITDFVTGDKVNNICRVIYNDGCFEWTSEEAYLLEKYDLEIEESFIEHVVNAK